MKEKYKKPHKADWLGTVIEQNTVGEPIVQIERLKQAIRVEIEKRFPEEKILDETLSWSLPYKCGKSFNRAIRLSKKNILKGELNV